MPTLCRWPNNLGAVHTSALWRSSGRARGVAKVPSSIPRTRLTVQDLGPSRLFQVEFNPKPQAS